MTRSTRSIRRATVTIALAGVAAFGTVALAPAASAAQSDVDGSSYTITGPGAGGPDYFLVTERGRKPIFFCEADQPNKRKNVCQEDPTTATDRF